jgi:hypothetical protein
VKIVVAGSSASQFVVPRSSRAEGTFGELLPEVLAAQGIAAEVQQTGQWYGTIRDLRRDYERAVRTQFPDVLVLNYGMAECQPNIPPLWFVRHVYSWNRSTHPIARAYRRRLLEPGWRAIRGIQRPTSSWAPHRISPKRFVAELQQVITMTRAETAALVLLVEIDPPGPRVEHWWPGLSERVKRYNGLLHEVAGESVVVADTARHVVEHGFEQVLPDGLHRSPFGHRLTAEVLSKEVQAWQGR